MGVEDDWEFRVVGNLKSCSMGPRGPSWVGLVLTYLFYSNRLVEKLGNMEMKGDGYHTGMQAPKNIDSTRGDQYIDLGRGRRPRALGLTASVTAVEKSLSKTHEVPLGAKTAMRKDR